tara:strand:+ start:91 stop:279 length:189 start_codon:yes stop_codon:yes gene_type:complete
MKLKKHGLGLYGQTFQGKMVKKKKSLFLRDSQVPTFYGVGIFEWAAVLGVLGVVMGSILKNF